MRKGRTVKALDNSPERMLDSVYNPRTSQYYVPYNPALADYRKMHQAGFTGNGITMAILDTGMLSKHPWLQPRIVGSVDFTGEGTEDRNGHGTVVALIASLAAPGAGLLNVKVLGHDKNGFEEDLIAGLRWAAEHEARVVNLSLGVEREPACIGSCQLCAETRKIVQETGVLVVASAGNRPGSPACPANCEAVLSVGATDLSGTHVADYSAAAQVYAPGTVMMVPFS